MTGQQKVERICTLQTHFTLNKKGEEKENIHAKNKFQQPPKKTKSFKKIISKRRPHSWTKEKCQSRQMTCHNPFKKKKDTEERRKTIKNPFQTL